MELSLNLKSARFSDQVWRRFSDQGFLGEVGACGAPFRLTAFSTRFPLGGGSLPHSDSVINSGLCGLLWNSTSVRLKSIYTVTHKTLLPQGEPRPPRPLPTDQDPEPAGLSAGCLLI